MEMRLLLLLSLVWTPTRGKAVQVVCVAMETCLLPCSFKAVDNLLQIEIEWFNEKTLMHHYKNSSDQREKQDKTFSGRTSMFPEQISRGNGSLQLSHVRPIDEQKYLCQISKSLDLIKKEYVDVKVEGPVRAVTLKHRGDVLVCSSDDLYPKPNISWPHSELHTQENGLYSINSSLSLDLTPPQSYTCNISTPSSWKSATYILRPPVKRSANVSFHCVDSIVPEKSLEWTFNKNQTIVTRRGGQVTVADLWKPFVEAVSELGRLTLKDLSSEHEGVFICELHTDDITYISRTELKEADASGLIPVDGAIVGVAVILVLGVLVGVYMLWRRRKHKKPQNQDDTRSLEEQRLLFNRNEAEDLEEFDLRKYTKRDLSSLVPTIKASSKVIMCSCGLSQTSFAPDAPLASLFSSSKLTHLDLSNNDLQDSVVELLCEGLKDASSGLKYLCLSLCGLSSASCAPLASVLSSLSLTHLDLSNNDLQDAGVKLLREGLMDDPCTLETLKLSGCLISDEGGNFLVVALSSTLSHVKELDLRYNNLESSADILTNLKANSSSSLRSLRLNPAGKQFMVPRLRKYACEFSLDENTAQKKLLRLNDTRSVACCNEEQPYPDHSDRFTDWCQVLSSGGLTGRCYWEVEWRGDKIDIAMSYKGIRRKGNEQECVFGGNDQSWSLQICEGEYAAAHNQQRGIVPGREKAVISSDQLAVSIDEEAVPSGKGCQLSGRVAVFLDHDDGVLSFYEVISEGKLRHLHTFNSSFIEPLFLGFKLDSAGSSVSVVDLL